MQPQQASELACAVLTGVSEGLAVQEFLRELVVGAETPSDLAGSIIVKILHSVEGGDVEHVCSNLKTNLSCLRLLITLSLSHLCSYLTCSYSLHLYMLDIYLCIIDIYAWGCLNIVHALIPYPFLTCLILCLCSH